MATLQVDRRRASKSHFESRLFLSGEQSVKYTAQHHDRFLAQKQARNDNSADAAEKNDHCESLILSSFSEMQKHTLLLPGSKDSHFGP